MDPDNLLSRAQAYLMSALQLLDEANAPSDIGAHVDVAIARLSETLSAAEQSSQHESALRKISRGSDATN